jgi:hypothetical protein
MRTTNADRIIAVLRQRSDLDDDEIAAQCSIDRHSVNQECRLLEGKGVLDRRPGPREKIVNRLLETGEPQRPLTPAQPAARQPSAVPPAAIGRRSTVEFTTLADFKEVLVIIPCSGGKANRPSARSSGPTILDDLPTELSQRLKEARQGVAAIAKVNETTLLPAWQRYAGYLYQAAAPTLENAIEDGNLPHLLILSGGYGIVRAKEPIGIYNLELKLKWWRGLLEEVIVAYAQKHGLRRARLFASSSADYARVLKKVAWDRCGVTDALLHTPGNSSNPRKEVPWALGQCLAAMLQGEFDESWKSKHSLTLDVARLA